MLIEMEALCQKHGIPAARAPHYVEVVQNGGGIGFLSHKETVHSRTIWLRLKDGVPVEAR